MKYLAANFRRVNSTANFSAVDSIRMLLPFSTLLKLRNMGLELGNLSRLKCKEN
jgi:hypothetical protein